jgi:ABC-2 type transport system permease protein
MTIAAALDTPAAPVRARRIVSTLRAEWTKIRTLRSTWFTVAGAFGISVTLAGLVCLATVSQWDDMTPRQRAEFDPTNQALIGVLFAAVILGSLAVRAITAEYATGMIRVTFSAMPGRRAVLGAKAAILAAIAIPVGLLTNLASFLVAQQVLEQKDVSMSLGQPGVLKVICFGAVTVSLVAVIGLALGGIIRRTAGATTALMLLTIGSQIFGIALPEGARQYLPGSAMQATVAVQHAAGTLTPGKALAVLAAYAVVLLAAASRLIASRDA